MESTLISVVICTRNRPQLLPRAINSLITQTYKNFELLIADGSSNDLSEEVVKTFSDPRIKYFKIENEKNAASTINYALSKCNGKYIALQDDDDESLPSRLEKQITLFEKLPPEFGIIYCWEEIFDDKFNKPIRISKPNLRGDIFLQLIEKGGNTGGGTQLMIRNEVIKEMGGYSEDVFLGADYLFYLNISKKYQFEILPEVLVKTHINHEYYRSSDLISEDRIWINYSVDMTNYLLNKYSNEFKLYPKKKYYHYENLLLSNAKLKNFRECFKYLFLLLDPKMFRFRTIRTTIKAIKYLIIKF